jgi:hypothetical protein
MDSGLDVALISLLLGLALWIGLVALQLADLVLTASRIPKLSAYVAIRDELVQLAEVRLSAEQLDSIRERLAGLDEIEAARTVPPGRSATAQLWTRSPWRLVPVGISIVPMVLLAVSSAPLPALLAVSLPVVAYVLALAAARAAVAAAGARAVVRDAQRAEIEELLREAARSARPPVAGLGDRVRRALSILREQQS